MYMYLFGFGIRYLGWVSQRDFEMTLLTVSDMGETLLGRNKEEFERCGSYQQR
jgi:hypothetical protein